MTIKGILFDKDGTLLDFAATWTPVLREAAEIAAGNESERVEQLLAVGGWEPTAGRVRAGSLLAAGNTVEIAAAWADCLPGRDGAELVPLLDQVFQDGGARHATAVTELAPLFARLKVRGLALGVATSDSLEGARTSLAAFDVIGRLDFLAGYDSGHGAKPGPGMVEGFCATVDLLAAEVAVVGDNLHDLEMGRRAGAGMVVGVLTGTGGRNELAPAADHVLSSIVALEGLLDSL